MQIESIKELAKKVAELKRRIPPHSVPPAMIQELDEREEEIEKGRAREKEGSFANTA